MRVSGVDLKASRFNGIMMTVVHGDRTIFIQRRLPGYTVTHLVPIPDGTEHDRYHFGDLNNVDDLKDFLNLVAEKLGLT